jgi:hypothetical protein
VDTFDALARKWFSLDAPESLPATGVPRSPFRRVIMFVDNAGAPLHACVIRLEWGLLLNIRSEAANMLRAGADVVLGMIPFARELLRMGAEVVMVANSLPAINDITTPELRALLQAVSETDPVIKVRRRLASANRALRPAALLNPRMQTTSRCDGRSATSAGGADSGAEGKAGQWRRHPILPGPVQTSALLQPPVRAGRQRLAQQPQPKLWALADAGPLSCSGGSQQAGGTAPPGVR